MYKVQCIKFKLISILLFRISINLFAQYDEELSPTKSTTPEVKGWQPGYIVTKTTSDTIKGFMKIKTSMFNEVMRVSYKKDKEDKRHKYDVSSDSIWRFGYAYLPIHIKGGTKKKAF